MTQIQIFQPKRTVLVAREADPVPAGGRMLAYAEEVNDGVWLIAVADVNVAFRNGAVVFGEQNAREELLAATRRTLDEGPGA